MTLQAKLTLNLCLILVLMNCLACQEENDPQERLSKLRAIGVELEPMTEVGVANAVAVLVVPSDQQVTVQPFFDSEFRFGCLARSVTASSVEIERQAAGLQVIRIPFQIDADLSLLECPALAGLDLGLPVRVRFGLQITSGTEEETIVGDQLIVPSNLLSGLTGDLDVEILAPAEDGAVPNSKSDLLGVETNPQQQPIKIGWFVSSGSLKNRRDLSTEWDKKAAGENLIVLSLRSRNSLRFSYKIRTVVVQ